MKIRGKGFVPGYAYGKILDLSKGLLPNTLSGIFLLSEPSLEKMIQLAEMKPSGVLIVGTQRFSHCLIYLFSLGIPSIFITRGQANLIKHSKVFMNGDTGAIYLNPDEHSISSLKNDITNHRKRVRPTQNMITPKRNHSVTNQF